ncbi:MAG: hypothetical protein ACLP8S_04085 [Solirubrobacteraceae bacterium]
MIRDELVEVSSEGRLALDAAAVAAVVARETDPRDLEAAVALVRGGSPSGQ